MKRSTLIAVSCVGAAVVISAVAYRYLPDPVPVHWGWSGEADNFVAKPLGPFLLPLIMAGLALFPVFGRPRAVGRHIRNAALALLLYVHGAATLYAIGYPLSISAVALVGVGALFMVIGNVLGKTRRNPFVGLRTPWTMLDDEVWLRSNRFAGWTMVLGGIALIAGGLAGAGPWLLLAVLAPTVLAPVAHSYVMWRRLEARR